MSEHRYEELRRRLGEIADVGSALSLLGWDQQTKMPAKGAGARAHAAAALTKIHDQLWTDPALGELLDSLAEWSEERPYDSDEASIVRVTTRDYRKNLLVPTDLKVEMSTLQSEGYVAWVKARGSSDFSLLQPTLERIVDLHRRIISLVREADPSFAEDYDVLVDDYEPGLQATEIARVFEELKEATVPLVARVVQRSGAVSDSLVHGAFPRDAQETSVRALAQQLGFTDDTWRIDDTQHPFATSIALDDIRITTRYFDDFMNPAWFGTMHEFGHGLYEKQVGRGLERTPLAQGASMAFHESQSRMWENLIGRGRPFWAWGLPHLKAAYPDQFVQATEDDIYRAVNTLGPSFIRVEADELTYNLHIILRFEIERDLFSGKLEVADLPRVWNERFASYFGMDVPDDAQGVLQDVHWGAGSFGYFPTYALGNVVSLQLWDRLRRDIPDLDTQTAQGEFGPLREWLGTNIHQFGRKYLPTELLERVVGTASFDSKLLITYLTAKVTELYGE
jgi:carboxypeptidase Taq